MMATTEYTENGSTNTPEPDPQPEAVLNEIPTIESVELTEIPNPIEEPDSVEATATLPAEKRWPGWPGDCVFRLIVPVTKVGSIIGRKGELIKKMCEDTRARIKVLDGPVGNPDRIVLISGKEEPEVPLSPAMDATIRIFKRVSELSENDGDAKASGATFCTIRLLVASTQAINLIGKQGSLIKSIQESTSASVRVLSGDELPVYASTDERVVEIQDNQRKKNMEREGEKSGAVPLLQSSSSSGTASTTQTLGNIIVSIVGTGVLGLPFAFRVAGWFAGSLGVTIAGISTCYCMLLLVQCRDKLASEEESAEVKTYGDLGYKCMGKTGRYVTEFLIFISQCGGSISYLIFIGQNLLSIFKTYKTLTYSAYIFLVVPIQIALSWINSLSSLAAFSIFADICNVLAMALVIKENVEKISGGEFSFKDREAITNNIGGLPFAAGMAVFCFEGFGMTLALEASMKERGRFSKLLAQAFTGITLVYVLFGFFGYMAYGDQTMDIVTLNLPHNWWSIAVQMGLCLGIVFTFPIMVHPIHEIVEGKLKKTKLFQKLPCNAYDNNSTTTLEKFVTYIMRAVLIVGLATLASCVPGFSVFVSLVGSTVCALVSFVLPATFHLKLLGSSLNFWQKALDFCILFCGLIFAAYGTYNSIVGV